MNLRPGVDPDATPLCVVTCSCDALSFGDLDDLQGSISQIIKERHTIRIFDQLETNPSVYYIIS
jgi:phenylacetyl-CoA:acceptor oxidoreductase subunit 1